MSPSCLGLRIAVERSRLKVNLRIAIGSLPEETYEEGTHEAHHCFIFRSRCI